MADARAFAHLRPEWDSLVQRAGLTHPFLSHDWVHTWWECFGAGAALHVLVVRDAGEAIAIAPLMLRRTRMYGLEVRALEFLANDHTPRADFILSTRPRDAVQAIWSHLYAHAADWDLLQCRQVPDASPTLAHLPSCAERDGCLVSTRPGDHSPFVPFDGSWAEYFAGLSRNHRSKIRKGLNRLSRVAAVSLETIAGEPSLDAALEDGVRIEAAAWKERHGTAIASDEAVRHFYLRFARIAASRGTLRLFFLRAGAERIAFAYALETDHRLFVLKAGYDPAYARYSPYNLLCALVFEDGFARGLAEYEFLGENDPWKLDWTRHVRPHRWLLVFTRSLRARLLHFAKCRLVPRLQRERVYVAARDRLRGWIDLRRFSGG